LCSCADVTLALDLNPALNGTLAERTTGKGAEVDIARVVGQDNTPDIACELGVEQAATQAERWLLLGRDAEVGRAETADGMEIRFRGEPAVERELRDLVGVESRCCAWARWEVRRAGSELVLRVGSTPEGAAALHAMFGARQTPPSR
jgi:hypothetical protein